MAFVIILVLIVLNGYFSLAEVALISVSNTALIGEQNKNNKTAFDVLQLIKDPEEFLSAVQVGTTLVGLLEGIYGGGLVATELEHWFAHWGMGPFVAHVAALVIGIGAITYLTIVLGELVPKSLALQMPMKMSLAIAPSLLVFSKILFPFIKMLTGGTRYILSLFSIKTADNQKITEKELKSILGSAYKQGVLGKQEYWLHENVFAFDDLKARSIMKPARIVVSLSDAWPWEKVFETIKRRPYSYFPVYKGEDKDKIVGAVRTKDLFLNPTDHWQDNLKPNCLIPSDMAAKDIFTLFKETRVDFGIVVGAPNEFQGIVAMQDIMEGVFGDLPEIEDYKAYFYKQSDKVWIAEGFIHLQRIRHDLGLAWLRDYESRYLSLGELMAGESDQGTLVLNGVKFEVVGGTKADPRTVRITLP